MFAEVVRRHGPLMRCVCRRLCRSTTDDAFQATFLVLACRAEVLAVDAKRDLSKAVAAVRTRVR